MNQAHNQAATEFKLSPQIIGWIQDLSTDPDITIEVLEDIVDCIIGEGFTPEPKPLRRISMIAIARKLSRFIHDLAEEQKH